MRPSDSEPLAPRWMTALLVVIALGAALQALSAVAIPVVFAVLIALTVAPLHARLLRALPDGLRALAHLAIMALLIGLLALALAALVFAAEQVLQAMPDLSSRIEALMQRERDAAAALPEAVRALWGQVGGSLGNWLVTQATGLARSVASVTGMALTTLVVVFFLVLLALTERPIWRAKCCALSPDGAEAHWSGALHSLSARLQRFLVIRSGIGVLQGALYVGWLALFGVDLLFVWGLLTFLLTFIPNIGSVISGSLPVLYALVTKDVGTALGVAAGILVIEQVIGNFVDPRLLGRQILLSPFVILVGLMVWGALWGIAGAFLATPILLSLLVVFNQIEALRPVALILSDQRSPEALQAALGGDKSA